MHRNTLFPVIAAALCAAAITMTVHAGEKVYKWTDAEGVVHYGQQPPTETASEAIKVQKGYSTAAEPDPEELSEEQKKARQQADICQAATQNFTALSGEGEVEQADEYGNVHTLSTEQRAEQMGRAKAAMEQNCTPGTKTPAPP
ncbi:MAG: DUF4124 domain-containing protein [Gammaproteobacteria bacterium]|nr:DUF4124 domain-containing protein [Gammaproteobacteria bacterium]